MAKKKKKKAKTASARAVATKRKAKKAPARKTKAKTKAKKKSPAKKAKASAARRKPAKAAKKPAAKKTAKKTGRKKQIVGEGDYAATRKFDKDQAGFVARNKSAIPGMGKAAEAALDGPEGDSLRDAEATAASRSRDTF